jgi:serine/threonine protein kinase
VRTLAGGETFGDRFDIVAEAGRGGMGKVFEAIDRTTGQKVALKVVTSAADHDRFRREAEVLESLTHVAIVRYVCHGTTGEGFPYLAMEWLDGESLSTRLKRGKLPVLDAIVMAERIAGALAYAHAHGVVHRDLKPSNVYLRDGAVDRATLIDFGVAKTDDKNLTTTGQMIGTPGYMAPEQVRGEKGIDQRVDVFALGCVLYEAMSGRAPFDGGEVMEVLSRLLLERPAPLGDVAPRISHLLDAMLAKNATYRVTSCAVIADELSKIARALTANDRETLTSRSSAIPTPPRDTPLPAGVKSPAFTLHTSSSETVGERPSSRRVGKSRTGLWVAIAVLGAVIGGAVGAYLVLRKTEVEKEKEKDTIVVPPAPVEPVCKQDDRTGCKALCEKGNAKACQLHGEDLIAGNRTNNRKPAIDAFRRACDLGISIACSDAAELMIDEAGTVLDIADAYELLLITCTERADLDACRFLAQQFRDGGAWAEPATAFKLFDDYCGKGNDPMSCDQLLEMVTQGEGTATERKRSTAVLAAACKRGIKEACG